MRQVPAPGRASLRVALAGRTAKRTSDPGDTGTWENQSMAQVNKQSIILGGGHLVGTVSVDGGAVRGVGGPVRPQARAAAVNRDESPARRGDACPGLALRPTRIRPARVSSHQLACQPISYPLVGGFHAHSLPHGTTDHTAYLRFFLSTPEVEDLERRRQATNTEVVELYLRIPVEFVHPFRSNPYTCFGVFVHLVKGLTQPLA